MDRGKKFQNEDRTFVCLFVCFLFVFCFLFVCLLFTFQNDENFFWVYQNGNFLPVKKHFTPGKKSGKMTLPPQKNFPVTPLSASWPVLNRNFTFVCMFPFMFVIRKRPNIQYQTNINCCQNSSVSFCFLFCFVCLFVAFCFLFVDLPSEWYTCLRYFFHIRVACLCFLYLFSPDNRNWPRVGHGCSFTLILQQICLKICRSRGKIEKKNEYNDQNIPI